jgi:hypothetical protein
MNIYTLQTPKACPFIGIFCMNMQKIHKCNRLPVTIKITGSLGLIFGRIPAAFASPGGRDRAIRSNLLAPLSAPPKVFPLLSLARGKPLRGLPEIRPQAMPFGGFGFLLRKIVAVTRAGAVSPSRVSSPLQRQGGVMTVRRSGIRYVATKPGSGARRPACAPLTFPADQGKLPFYASLKGRCQHCFFAWYVPPGGLNR